MSITNPLTILFWLGIYGSVLAETASTYGKGELFLYSSAIFIGLLIWDITMAAISSSFRNYLNVRILTFISIFSGLVLVAFGIYFGYQGIQNLLTY
jgi:L-lysine exporter family protein LysE/ArgO